MSRKTARETVMKYTYQMEASGEFKLDKLQYILESEGLDGPDSSFVRKSLEKMVENINDIDHSIESHLENWKMERIPKVDLAILRVAVNEINNMDEIPDSVAINEAVDMAKEYSTAESYKFINGVLGTYFRSRGE